MSTFLEKLASYNAGINADINARKAKAVATAAPIVAALKDAKAFFVRTDYVCSHGKGSEVIGIEVKSMVPRVKVIAYISGVCNYYLFTDSVSSSVHSDIDSLLDSLAYAIAKDRAKSPCK